ncbi:MAG: HD domain-containing protein [Candidatus Omnitrophota bacterium]|nr:HD domain-containing protein [Candidatus Omnitrophota bacterium]
MKILNFKSFQFQVTIILILAMLFAGALSNFLIYRFALDAQFKELRNKLIIIAQTAVLTLDADMLMQVPLNRSGIHAPQYKIIAEKLKKIQRINQPIKYIYTMTKTKQPGAWQFIVDPNLITKKGKKKFLSSYPGDLYNAGRFPAMLKAFEGPSADTKMEIDEWGTTLSGYAPIRDATGKTVAILGVDLTADEVYVVQREVHRRALFVLMLGVIFSILMGILISRKISYPLKRLLTGTRHIANGNLQYQVETKGADEIRELAKSFNQMAQSLEESRRNLVDYFYGMVQSLVRVLEARDPYTRGHSERVAEYAQKIAIRMVFPQEKIELLKEVALLHDIGKLGIKENILNKKEALTEEEWEAIRKHSLIGEDILKPFLSNTEMLTIIRQHHERYDGTGYPDKIVGENINIFAAIISVADAYDAMTSPRAYRSALTREKAIEELVRNRGTQFNPKIVDVFMKVLDEKGR